MFSIQKLTIRKQLLLFILPLIVLIISINSFLLYQKAADLLIIREKKKKENIKNGVSQFVDNYDLSLKLIELDVKQRINLLFDEIIDSHNVDLQNQDLDQLQAKLKMNPLTEDIYIINNEGVVVNTTFSKDLNLNLFDFGIIYENFFRDILANKKRVIERVAIESNTQTQKKYGYLAINENYILEIGIKFESISHLTKNIELKFNDLSNRYSNIKSINLYSATEVLQSKINGQKIDESLKQFAIDCYTNKRDTTIINKKQTTQYTDLVFLEMRDAEYFKGYVLEIKSDDSLSKALVKSESKGFLIRLSFSIIIIILGLLYITKRITKPIKNLTHKVSKMTNSSTINDINIKGSIETRLLSENFNLLGEKIRESQQGLEQKINIKTEELTLKNKELNNLLTERDTLIKEIHHRIKNNLQIIASLLRLQSRSVASEDAKLAFENSVGRIQAMALLHEKLYKNSNFVSVDSKRYLEDLSDLFRKSIPNLIQIKLHDNNILLGSSQAISIGLIVNEFIANSVKHGFAETQKGVVNIRLDEVEDKLHLILTNDGKKLPDNFKSTNQDSLGMTIIDAFTDKLDGVFEFHNISTGVELKVVFDKKYNFEEE